MHASSVNYWAFFKIGIHFFDWVKKNNSLGACTLMGCAAMGWGGQVCMTAGCRGRHQFLSQEEQAVPVVWAAICMQAGVGPQLEACGGPVPTCQGAVP